MITPPRKSVTRFFIPLIDVLILLFCIFLLMPFVSGPPVPEPLPDETKNKTLEKALPTEVKLLQDLLREEQMRVARLEKEKLSKISDRLAVRVLEIDATNGTLFYYDPNREEIKSDAEALRLITKQKTASGVKDVFFLILYPRRASAYPTAAQVEQIKLWFKDVPHGFDIP